MGRGVPRPYIINYKLCYDEIFIVYRNIIGFGGL